MQSLLTLTSYPFRILHANEAFHNMTGKAVIGEPLSEIFAPVSGADTKPTASAARKLSISREGDTSVAYSVSPMAVISTGKPPNENVRLIDSSLHGCRNIRCKVQVLPVLKDPRRPGTGLMYYAIILEQELVTTA